jgi:hypothetical protein
VSISFDDYPCLFTEAGYNNSLQTNASLSVPEWASNIYAPKAPCDFFKRRASYFRFELMDDPDPINFASQDTINTTADIEAHYGLVAMTTESASVQDNPPDTWRKKPEFYTMRRWIALLADRDPLTFQPVAFTPAPLSYAVQGETSVQDLLVQKHDGHHFLIVWRDVDVFDPDPSVRLDLRGTIAPEPVDITLEEAATVLIYKPSTGGTAATATPIAQARVLAGQSVRLGLDYDLQILEIW